MLGWFPCRCFCWSHAFLVASHVLQTPDSPYIIMFGPDRCGDNNKVHFILRHQNPVSKEWEEKHFESDTPVRPAVRTGMRWCFSTRTHMPSHFYLPCSRCSVQSTVELPSQLQIQGDRFSHLYTLVVRQDNTFTIKVGGLCFAALVPWCQAVAEGTSP